MKNVFLILILGSLFSTHAFAMGAKRPVANPSPIPANGTTTPTIDLGADVDPTEYLNASAIVGPSVDSYQKQNELSVVRTNVNSGAVDYVDKCFSDTAAHDLFSDQISYYVGAMLKDTPAMVGVIGSYYGTSDNDNNYFPTSLIRHPLCNLTSSGLKSTLKNVPSQTVIDKLNRFANTVNALRSQVIAGDTKAKAELLSTWSRLFSCLAYTESLISADTSNSNSVAAKYSPAGYRKPAGVEFYEDPSQDPASRLNVGAFQFTPTSSGNIQSCLRAWNVLNNKKASCQVPLKGSQADMIKVLGSSLQSFNAFCGVHKLIQTFAIQVNTTKSSATYPSNSVNGKLKDSELRCVTPHFLAGRAYNHFGPFQNSTGSNMDSLYSCFERSRN